MSQSEKMSFYVRGSGLSRLAAATCSNYKIRKIHAEARCPTKSEIRSFGSRPNRYSLSHFETMNNWGQKFQICSLRPHAFRDNGFQLRAISTFVHVLSYAVKVEALWRNLLITYPKSPIAYQIRTAVSELILSWRFFLYGSTTVRTSAPFSDS
jgi:hypothetical protein